MPENSPLFLIEKYGHDDWIDDEGYHGEGEEKDMGVVGFEGLFWRIEIVIWLAVCRIHIRFLLQVFYLTQEYPNSRYKKSQKNQTHNGGKDLKWTQHMIHISKHSDNNNNGANQECTNCNNNLGHILVDQYPIHGSLEDQGYKEHNPKNNCFDDSIVDW